MFRVEEAAHRNRTIDVIPLQIFPVNEGMVIC